MCAVTLRIHGIQNDTQTATEYKMSTELLESPVKLMNSSIQMINYKLEVSISTKRACATSTKL